MLSYVSILLIAALLGITLIQSAAKRIETEYIGQKTHRAEMLLSQIDSMTESLIRLDYLLAMDDTRRQMILEPGPYNEYMLIRELKRLRLTDLSGSNLFLCSTDGDYVYDVGGKCEKSAYWRSSLGMSGGEKLLSEWQELIGSTFVPCRDDDGNEQLLFVYPLRYVTWYEGDRQAFLVEYFSSKALKSLAESFKGDMTDDFILLWKDTPVLYTVEPPETERLAEFASKADRNGAVNGCVGDQYCIALKPMYPGFRLLLLAGNSEILTIKSEYLRDLSLIMLPFILIGVVLVVWYARRHYSSVRQLANRFDQEQNQKGNEFQRIEEGIDRIHRKDSELIERIGEIDHELKQMLLEGVVNGIRAEQDELSRAGVELNGGIRSVLCARGDDAVLREWLPEGSVKTVWTEKYAALAVIAPKADEARAYAESAIEMGAAAVGISYFADGADGICRAFLQAFSACGEAQMNGGGILIYNAESVESIDETHVSRYMYLQKAIQGGNAELAEWILSDIRSETEKLGFVDAKCERYVLLNSLRRAAEDQKIKLSQDALFQAVSSERPDAFYEAAGQLVLGLCEEATRQREKMDLTIQSEIIRYIEEHFADYEISTESICVQFRLSVNNFSRIVKERTGCTPREYIIKLRMEEARRLLLETDESVNSISRKVGYAGASHFIKTFKQYYDVTPAQMRGGKTN